MPYWEATDRSSTVCIPLSSEATVGTHKCDSAAAAIAALNSNVKLELYRDGFTPANAIGIVEKYDVVVDASDNAPTRYLIRYGWSLCLVLKNSHVCCVQRCEHDHGRGW